MAAVAVEVDPAAAVRRDVAGDVDVPVGGPVDHRALGGAVLVLHDEATVGGQVVGLVGRGVEVRGVAVGDQHVRRTRDVHEVPVEAVGLTRLHRHVCGLRHPDPVAFLGIDRLDRESLDRDARGLDGAIEALRDQCRGVLVARLERDRGRRAVDHEVGAVEQAVGRVVGAGGEVDDPAALLVGGVERGLDRGGVVGRSVAGRAVSGDVVDRVVLREHALGRQALEHVVRLVVHRVHHRLRCPILQARSYRGL